MAFDDVDQRGKQQAAAQQPQPQPIKPSTKNQKKQKAAQQFQRVPQQVVKDYIPMYKSPNATPISDNSISTYLSQFKKVYEHFTKKNVPDKLKNELINVLQLKKYDKIGWLSLMDTAMLGGRGAGRGSSSTARGASCPGSTRSTNASEAHAPIHI